MNQKTFDADSYKQGQVQQWDSVADGWEKWWPTFEKSTQNVSQCLIDLAEIKQSQKVLDIATGIGEPSVTIAQHVGSEGQVVAIDQSSQMLGIASKRVEALGIKNIEFQEIDAEALDFPNDFFDAITCRWGLMFLPDISATIESLYRMLKRKGRFATAIWDVPENIPFFNIAVMRLRQMFDIPLPPPQAPTLSGLAEGKIEDLLREQGFTNIETKADTVAFEFISGKEYVQFMKDVAAPIKAMLSKQSEEDQNNYWKSLEADAQKFSCSDEKIRLESVSLCVAAQK